MARNEYDDGYTDNPGYDEPPPQDHQPPATTGPQQGTALAIAEQWGQETGLAMLSDLLPPGLDAKRMLAAWLGAFTDNPDLEACTPESKGRTIMDCARVGLWPGPAQHVDIIPYGKSATTQVGWKGVVALLKRDAGVSHVQSRAIHENEPYTITVGSEPRFEVQHRIADRGALLAWYAVAYFPDGSPPAFEVMTEEEMQYHKKRYRSAKSGPWDDAYPEMARKTVVKRLAKHVGAGDVLAYALRLDPTTALPDSRPRYVDPDPNDMSRTAQIRRRLNR